MSLPRPYIPLSVRVAVAQRQWGESTGVYARGMPDQSQSAKLEAYLYLLFGDATPHLDHNPPLAARERIIRGGVVVGYRPDANDPDHLIYRTVDDHRVKTNVRGDGAQHPDRVLIKKERRRQKPKKKKHWRWPKGRKIPSRQFASSKLRGKSRCQSKVSRFR